MSSPSSSPEPTHSGPIPRGRRGNTCYNCRRRKIKCDGGKPQCINCARGGITFEDCEYPTKGGSSQVALLEERIDSIKHRIRLLEAPEVSQEVSLHQPYHSGSSGGHSPSSFGVPAGSPTSTTHSSGSSPRPSVKPLWEMSQQEKQSHVSLFLGQSQHVGFFLAPEQLWALAALNPQTPNYSPGLMDAILAWSSYWSSRFAEGWEYLRRAVEHLSNDSGLTSARPRSVMHTIQADVLVSYYFFAEGKALEGIHHANSALSVALASGLHRINASDSRTSSTYLPPCSSYQERDERINAFWTVISLITHWITVKHSDSLLSNVDFAAVTTPWPVDPEVQGLQEYSSERSLDTFLRGVGTSGYSTVALYVKAGILLERAISYHTAVSVSANPSGQFVHLDGLIETFKSGLPSVDSDAIGDRGIVTHLLAAAATIRLHLPYINTATISKRKCIFAAHAIAHMTNVYMINDIDRQFLDPIIGTVWMSAAEVLMPHVMSGSLVGAEHANAVASLEAIFNQWNKVAECVEMFASLMDTFEKECASSFKSFA